MRIVLVGGLWLAVCIAALSAQGSFHIHPGTHCNMTGASRIILKDLNLRNDGSLNSGQGAFHFVGNEVDSILGSSPSTIHELVLEKNPGKYIYITPDVPCTVPFRIRFDFKENRIVLGGNDLILGPSATIVYFGPLNYIVTLDDSRVVKQSLTDFFFPVGSGMDVYQPIRVTQNGAVDDLGVRCAKHVLNGGLSGTPLPDGVADVSWVIDEAMPGGSNLSLTAQWNGADELPGFNGNDCGVARYLDNGVWDLAAPHIGTKNGIGPYTRSRAGFTEPGVFAVGSLPLMYPLQVSAKTFLQGAYEPADGWMRDRLRVLGLVPPTEPYTGMPGFQHLGRGGAETAAPSVWNATGPDAPVDWVFVELRHPTNSIEVLETRAALIQRDGDVVDVDGQSPLRFIGRPAANYHLSIRHRNHLGIRTALPLNLSHIPTTYDFTTNAGQALDGTQAPLGAGAWGMIGGNADSNVAVRYSGPGSDQDAILNGCLGGNKLLILNNLYSNCDLNMNGVVRYSGPANEPNFLLNAVLGGDKLNVIVQPDF